MSVILALSLMQVAIGDGKLYHDANGFMVASTPTSCFARANYESGINTHIGVDNEIGFYFLLKQDSWQPVEGKRYKFNVGFDKYNFELATIVTKGGTFVVPVHPSFVSTYADSSGVEISWGSKIIAGLDLAGSAQAVIALRTCMKDMGIVVKTPSNEPPKKQEVSTDPFDLRKPVVLSYFADDGYPTEANGAEGEVKAKVTVGENGRAIDCTIIESSGSAVLDEAACKGLRRSRYTAAQDRAGQSIESFIEKSLFFEDPSKTVNPG